jgi:hypothetical protein
MKKTVLFLILIAQTGSFFAAASEYTPLLGSQERSSQPETKPAMTQEELFKGNWTTLFNKFGEFIEDKNPRHNMLYDTLKIEDREERHQVFLALKKIAAANNWPQYLKVFIDHRVEMTKPTVMNRISNFMGVR